MSARGCEFFHARPTVNCCAFGRTDPVVWSKGLIARFSVSACAVAFLITSFQRFFFIIIILTPTSHNNNLKNLQQNYVISEAN